MQEDLFKAVQLPDRHKCLAGIYAALSAGAEVTARDSNGMTALHLAAGYNSDAAAVAAVIAALVQEGADVDTCSYDGRQATALHWAALNTSTAAAAAAVRALVAAGATMHTDAYGREPLHWVAYQSCAKAVPAVVQALCAAGGNVNARERGHYTPLVSRTSVYVWRLQGVWRFRTY